jgi:hypothetical protein
MGAAFSGDVLREQPPASVRTGVVRESVAAPASITSEDGTVHTRNLPYDVVPFIDASDRATMRRLPMEAQYSAGREVRERQIVFAEMHALQKELSDCYYANGVNHHTVCKPLVETYLRRLARNDFTDSNEQLEFSRLKQPTNMQRH